jgi:hypothetical protein
MGSGGGVEINVNRVRSLCSEKRLTQINYWHIELIAWKFKLQKNKFV